MAKRDFESLKDHARTCRNWDSFIDGVQNFIDGSMEEQVYGGSGEDKT